MKNLLAIDTATDALSLALQVDGERVSRHQVMARRHQQRLFAEIEALCDGRALASLNLDAIVYGKGPGSFTGLRIAVSAAQGLAYSLGLPALGVSTLETQLRTLLRHQNDLQSPAIYLSTIDARIGQLYGAFFYFDGDRIRALGTPEIVQADALVLPDQAVALGGLPVRVLGSGLAYRDAMPTEWVSGSEDWSQVLPEAEDMLAPAERLLAEGALARPGDAQPDYVQQKVGWKTLAEQGKRA